MDQDDKKDAESKFPEGYEHIEDMANAAARQSRELDQRIKNIPTEDISQTRHRLQFNPPGFAKAEQAWKKRESRESLEAQKNQIEADLMKRIDTHLTNYGVEPEISAQIKTATVETLHPNPFKDKSKKELEVIKGMEKDPQHSQDYMRKMLDDHRKESRETTPVKTEKSESKKNPEMSMSARFNQTLGYSRYTQETERIMAQQPLKGKNDRDLDKD